MFDFDLISDLHLDQWLDNQQVSFNGIGTSLNCIVAGDVSSNIKTTRDFLYQLSNHYKQVIFVDGNQEHQIDYSNIIENCEWLEQELSEKSNITYLWDSTAVFGSTAIVGSNGWWTFDYCEPLLSRFEQIEEFCKMDDSTQSTAVSIWDEAVENSEFLTNVITEFNKIDIIKDIVIITHTLPRKDLITPTSFMNTGDLTKLYNSTLEDVLKADVNKKITTWCFGHYHSEACDKIIDEVRYISHPRGKPNDTVFPIYYPKLITLIPNR
jgi:hypothetical protein